MTWATVVDAAFKIKVKEPAVVEKILEEAEEVFECKIEYDESMDTFFLYNMSWMSHVTKERIDRFIKKYRELIEEFDADLYMLTAPHASWKIKNN
ncbi:MAG: hypothetical protein DRP20_05460 [Thermotogae bacterium]|nr:MAG: hypothetical protein DRP20_05460 [Thermotogota bacterium]